MKHTVKNTSTHSAQGTNHHCLFSGPVCEWDSYGRGGGGGGRHRCICRHVDATQRNISYQFSLFFFSFHHLETFLFAALQIFFFFNRLQFSFSFHLLWTLWHFLSFQMLQKNCDCCTKTVFIPLLFPHFSPDIIHCSLPLLHFLLYPIMSLSPPLQNSWLTPRLFCPSFHLSFPFLSFSPAQLLKQLPVQVKWMTTNSTQRGTYLLWQGLCLECFWILSWMKSGEAASFWQLKRSGGQRERDRKGEEER